MTWAGKSLVARHDIEKNSVITKDDLLLKDLEQVSLRLNWIRSSAEELKTD